MERQVPGICDLATVCILLDQLSMPREATRAGKSPTAPFARKEDVQMLGVDVSLKVELA